MTDNKNTPHKLKTLSSMMVLTIGIMVIMTLTSILQYNDMKKDYMAELPGYNIKLNTLKATQEDYNSDENVLIIDSYLIQDISDMKFNAEEKAFTRLDKYSKSLCVLFISFLLFSIVKLNIRGNFIAFSVKSDRIFMVITILYMIMSVVYLNNNTFTSLGKDDFLIDLSVDKRISLREVNTGVIKLDLDYMRELEESQIPDKIILTENYVFNLMHDHATDMKEQVYRKVDIDSGVVIYEIDGRKDINE